MEKRKGHNVVLQHFSRDSKSVESTSKQTAVCTIAALTPTSTWLCDVRALGILDVPSLCGLSPRDGRHPCCLPTVALQSSNIWSTHCGQ